jgi:hypothetical protein
MDGKPYRNSLCMLMCSIPASESKSP